MSVSLAPWGVQTRHLLHPPQNPILWHQWQSGQKNKTSAHPLGVRKPCISLLFQTAITKLRSDHCIILGTVISGTCFDAITAVCVGGVSISGGDGSIIGSFVGAAIVGVLNNLLNLLKVNANWKDVVSGIVINVAIAVDVSVKRAIVSNIKKSVR